MKKTIVQLALGALLLIGASRLAHANYGYVCYTSYYLAPISAGMGNYGAVSVGIYSGPSCTGTYNGGGYICSTGATSSSCDLTQLRDEAQAISLADSLQRAAAANQKIFLALSQSNNPYSVSFMSLGY